MPPTTFATATYTRRPVPTDAAQLPGWLQTELSALQRAVRPVRSRTVMADDRIKATDTILYVDASHGAITLTLPSPDQVHDLVVTVKKITAANTVTIKGVVDGVTNPVLSAQYATRTMGCDGSTFYLLSSI